MADSNTSPFEVTLLDHYIKYQPEAKDFSIDVEVKILRRQGFSPLEIFFSSSVNEYIWEDEDCPEKIELYEFFVYDAEIDAFEAQYLVNDMILYVGKMTQPLDEEFTGVFKLMVEVRIEPVELYHAGLEQTQSQL